MCRSVVTLGMVRTLQYQVEKTNVRYTYMEYPNLVISKLRRQRIAKLC